jgi:hypothetical protein
MLRKFILGSIVLLVLAGTLPSQDKKGDGWIDLFNGKDLTGWKLHWPSAKKGEEPLPPVGGWKVENGEYMFGEVGKPQRDPGQPTRPCDIVTERKFTDFELHVEFRVSGNGGVFLQGRYEIQISNAFGHKPKVFKTIERDGKKIETLDPHGCGGIVANIGPTKNMAKRPTEWQTYDVIFHGARGEKGKVTRKARVTLVWNGEKVIDDAEVDNLNNRPLDRDATEPGPILLQGLYAGVAYRNVRIKPLEAK